MEFILDYKWFFLITAEIIFWVCAIAFLILRYWYKFNRLSKFIITIFIINDLWIAFLAYSDYQRTGEFSVYQIIIVIFIVYAMTFGKTDFKKLDFFIKRQVAKYKGESLTALKNPIQHYGLAYALIEWKQFVVHVFVFAIVHIIFFITFGLSDALFDISKENWFGSWFNKETSTVPFNHESINKFSQVWLLVLLIDFAITLSYTIFPKKQPTEIGKNKKNQLL